MREFLPRWRDLILEHPKRKKEGSRVLSIYIEATSQREREISFSICFGFYFDMVFFFFNPKFFFFNTNLNKKFKKLMCQNFKMSTKSKRLLFYIITSIISLRCTA